MMPWIGISLFGAIIIFLVTQLMRTASVFISLGAGTSIIVLLLLLVPVLAFSMGPAVIISLFAVFAKLRETGEQIAIDALGIKQSRIIVSIVGFLLVATLINASLWIFLSPFALNKTRDLVISVLKTKMAEELKPGRFNSPVPGFVFFAEKRDGESFSKVFVEWNAPEGRWEITSSQAKISIKEDLSAHILFSSGRAFMTASKITYAANMPSVTTVSFKSFDLIISIEKALSDKLDFLPQFLCTPTFELLANKDSSSEANERQYAFWRRIAGPVGFFSLTFLGLVAAVGFLNLSPALSGAVAGSAFLLFHLLGRLGESFAEQKLMLPSIAAFLPAIIFIILTAGIMTWKLIRRTLRRRNINNCHYCSK